MTIFVLSNATIKPIWSIINTIFLLRLVTDLKNQSVVVRLMSHNLWHCMGKLCFASYLIHYEIILFLLKSRQEGLLDPNWTNVLREFSAAFLISTLISYFIYILYESPINKLITLTFVRSGHRDDDNSSSIEDSLKHHHDSNHQQDFNEEGGELSETRQRLTGKQATFDSKVNLNTVNNNSNHDNNHFYSTNGRWKRVSQSQTRQVNLEQ